MHFLYQYPNEMEHEGFTSAVIKGLKACLEIVFLSDSESLIFHDV